VNDYLKKLKYQYELDEYVKNNPNPDWDKLEKDVADRIIKKGSK
jgi:hypothetical protein